MSISVVSNNDGSASINQNGVPSIVMSNTGIISFPQTSKIYVPGSITHVAPTSSGSGTAYIVNGLGIAAYVSNAVYEFVAHVTNTTMSPTVAIDGLQAVNIVRGNGTTVSLKDLQLGHVTRLKYDGTRNVMVIENPLGTADFIANVGTEYGIAGATWSSIKLSNLLANDACPAWDGTTLTVPDWASRVEGWGCIGYRQNGVARTTYATFNHNAGSAADVGNSYLYFYNSTPTAHSSQISSIATDLAPGDTLSLYGYSSTAINVLPGVWTQMSLRFM